MAAISVGRQQGAKYDFGFADASGNFIGLMCVRDPKTGAPMYKEWSDPGLSQQYFSGQVGYANLEPQKELQFGSMTHHHGFGAEFFSGPNRYYMGTDWDNRFKGRGILGPKATAVTLPSVLSLVDVGLELWDDANTLTNWTYSESHVTSSLTRESTTVDSGTYAATIFVHVNGGQYGQITQEASSWDNAYRGTTFCISARCYSTDIAKVLGSMIITDGTNTTTVTATVDTTWENLVATHKIADDATKLEVTLKGTIATGGSSTVIFDSVKFPTVGVKGAAHAEFDSDLFISNGGFLLRMNESTGTVTIQGAFYGTISNLTKFAVSGTDYLFIFFAATEVYQYMTTAEVFTESNAAVKNFQFATWVNTTVDTLYANDDVNTVRSTIDPLNGGTAWSAATIVGSAGDSITHLQEKDGALLIDKVDMPYYLDSSGNVQKELAPECISGKATHSGKNSTIWLGEYFRPTGDQALLRAGTTNSWIQPSKYGTDIGNYSGQVEAVAGDEEYLHIITDNSTKVQIIAGREEVIDADTKWVWHPLQELTLTGCETAFISSIYKKRLYISSTASGESLYYYTLPTVYGNITTDANRNFKTGGTFEVGYLHGGFPTEDKLGLSATLTMGHTYDTDIYFNVYYKLLGGSWSSAVKFDGASGDMVDTQFLAGAATTRTSPMINLKFEGVTDDTTKTPILKDFTLNTILYPDVKTTYSCVVMCQKALRLKDNTTEADNVTNIKNAITNAKAATHPVTMNDIDGTSRTVKFLPISNSPHWLVSSHQANTGLIEREYRLYFMEVDLA